MKQVLNTKSATFLVIATFFLLYAFLYTRAVQKVQREGSLAEINLDHGKRATQHVLSKLTIDDYGGDEDEHGKEDYEDYEEEVKTEVKNEDDKDNEELSLQEMGMAKEENLIEHKIDSEKHQEEQSEKGEDVDKVNEGLKNRKRSNSRLRNGSKYAKNESSNLSGPNNVKHYAKKIARAKEAKALEDQKSLEKYLKSFDPSEVVENKSIFLFETNNDVEELAARTLCAMESAARTNIKRRIFLLISLPTKLRYVPSFLEEFPNIKLRTFNISEYVKDSFVEDLWNSGAVQKSMFYHSHCSDMLRYLTLHKFGGVYFDHDIISLREIPYEENFLAVERIRILATAVFGLRKEHPVLTNSLKILSKTFNGTNWMWNGPGVLTAAVKESCDIREDKDIYDFDNKKIIDNTCADITFIPPQEAGVLIRSEYFKLFYDPSKMFEVIVNVGSNFVIHYFNRMRTGIYEDPEGDPILVQQDQPLYKLMEKFCPQTVWKRLQYQIGKPY